MSTGITGLELGHRVVFSRERIQRALHEVAQHISHDFAGKDIVLVGVLKGAVCFLVDLGRLIEEIGEVHSCQVEFMSASSYGDHQTPGVVKIESDLRRPVTGLNVIFVEDIADTLQTLAVLVEHVAKQQPASLKIAVLLEKRDKHQVDVHLDYVGISEDNVGFVYGCGLDLAGKYRFLPFIAVADASGNPQPSSPQ